MSDPKTPNDAFEKPAFIEDDDDPQGEEKIVDDAPFTSADFHNLLQKQIVGTVYDTLVEAKLSWAAIEPFLEAAREMCRADFAEASIALHTVQEQDGTWIDAEEAFLGISVRDRDHGAEWLSDTYWVSDLATQNDDPDEVRRVIAGLQRSVAKLQDWLAEKETGGPAEAGPPAGNA